jgi:hypothetical protein
LLQVLAVVAAAQAECNLPGFSRPLAQVTRPSCQVVTLTHGSSKTAASRDRF